MIITSNKPLILRVYKKTLIKTMENENFRAYHLEMRQGTKMC